MRRTATWRKVDGLITWSLIAQETRSPIYTRRGEPGDPEAGLRGLRAMAGGAGALSVLVLLLIFA